MGRWRYEPEYRSVTPDERDRGLAGLHLLEEYTTLHCARSKCRRSIDVDCQRFSTAFHAAMNSGAKAVTAPAPLRPDEVVRRKALTAARSELQRKLVEAGVIQRVPSHRQ
jgi:hypothetical protein